MIRQGWPYFDGWPFPERWVHLDGLAIHYVDEGSGARPVVMVHGNPAWSYMWRRLVPAITSSGHRALAFDLMGFGKSDKPNPDLHDFPHHARIVSGYIESLGLRNLFFFSSRRRHTIFDCDWSSDVCSSDLTGSPMGSRRHCASRQPRRPAPASSSSPTRREMRPGSDWP